MIWTAERNQSGLFGMQRKAILAESLRQDRKESLGISFVLEQYCEVIRESNQSSTTIERPLHVPDEPLVEHLVQVDVREERRDHPSLRRSFIGMREIQSLDDPGVQPLSDQAQQHSVTYPSVKDRSQVGVIDG